jgi:hypothetical protein
MTIQKANDVQSDLAVPHYHLVFTLPHQLNGWVQLHPEVIYRLLFQALSRRFRGAWSHCCARPPTQASCSG